MNIPVLPTLLLIVVFTVHGGAGKTALLERAACTTPDDANSSTAPVQCATQVKRAKLRSIRVPGRLLPLLDLSCASGTQAPVVEHATVRYQRRKRKNKKRVKRGYMVARYECTDGYALAPGTTGVMFCSRKQWVGEVPACEPLATTTTELPSTLSDSADDSCGTVRQHCDHDCRLVDGAPTCICYPGFELRNDTCTDINECSVNNASCTHGCLNLPGSYRCLCPDGYRLDTDDVASHAGGGVCRDVNECLLNNGHGPCQDTCRNTNGSYGCSCERLPGTRLASDMHACVPGDGCLGAGCSHECLNARGGGAFCLCPSGMQLGADWKTCDDIDECEAEDIRASCAFGCVNTVGSYHCATFEADETTTTEGETAAQETSAEPTTTEVTTEQSYTSMEALMTTVLASTTEVLTSTMLATATEVSTTTRLPTTVLSTRDLTTSEFTTTEGTTTETTTTEPTTTETTITESITEMTTTEPITTETTITESTTEMTTSESTTTETTITESTTEMTTSESTTTETTITEPTTEMTTSESTTTETTTTETTTELTTAASTTTESTTEPLTTTTALPSTTETTTPPEEVQCEVGFTNNGSSCTDIDECSEDWTECSHDCTNTVGSYECSCPPGYVLDGVRCEDVDECSGQPCEQICANSIGSYSCACRQGYQLTEDGVTCELVDLCFLRNGGCSHTCTSSDYDGIVCTCPAGYELSEPENKTCEPVNPCRFRNGGCAQICTQANHTAQCTCSPGYVLEPDDKSCADIDECADSNGNCTHTCANLAGGYVCDCAAGYAPDFVGSSACTDVDECAVHNGGCSHRCANFDGGWMCDCPLGYELDASQRHCRDMNECLLENGGCSHGCVNLVGSWSCSCPPGYTLAADNASCVDADECATGNGGCAHLCVNSVGSFRCDCWPGYVLHEDEVHCAVAQPQSLCAKLKAPRNGRTRCSGEPLADGRHWSYGARCVVWCDKGYKLHGPTVRTCLTDGSWGDEQMTCIPVSCPRLTLPTHGRLLPTSCTTGKTFPGETCQLSCRRGYRLAPWADLGPRRTVQCLPSLGWRPQHPAEQFQDICIRDFPEPFITCPGGGELHVTLAPGARAAPVKIARPESNMDWWRYVKAVPAWGMQLATVLPAGRHQVTFYTWSPVNNGSASCDLTIHVHDEEPPSVVECPVDMRLRLYPGHRGRRVHWREPRFTDNVAITGIHKTQKSGAYLTAGEHRITYTARDESGNAAVCQFTVNLQEPEALTNKARHSYYEPVLVCPEGVHSFTDVQLHLKNHIRLGTGCYWRRIRKNRPSSATRHAATRHHRSHGVPWYHCCNT